MVVIEALRANKMSPCIVALAGTGAEVFTQAHWISPRTRCQPCICDAPFVYDVFTTVTMQQRAIATITTHAVFRAQKITFARLFYICGTLVWWQHANPVRSSATAGANTTPTHAAIQALPTAPAGWAVLVREQEGPVPVWSASVRPIPRLGKAAARRCEASRGSRT